MKRSAKRPRLHNRDRLFWILLSRFWRNWQGPLIFVKPETVIRWHRKGFKLFWKSKSRRKSPGRPPISREIRNLVRRMAMGNPFYGAPRIHGELLKLGIEISERTVYNLMPRRDIRPPSQTWRTFLKNHMINMGITEVVTAPRSPWQNPFVERLIGSIRRDCLDHVIVLNPNHLKRMLTSETF